MLKQQVINITGKTQPPYTKKVFTMDFIKMENIYGWIFGLFGGCISYMAGIPAFLNGHIPVLDIEVLTFIKKALGLLWAGSVAFISGVMGMAGKYWFDTRGRKLFKKWFRKGP